jgi:DNA-directed RNA polymerase specialized sigma24 family protein
MGDSDSRCLASAAAGDADAFARLYRHHLGAVTGVAIRPGTTPDDVADIVSETSIIALAARRWGPAPATARRPRSTWPPRTGP